MQTKVFVKDGHVFETDHTGNVQYFDLGDYHGGPHCVVCNEYWCKHCDCSIYKETCPDRFETLSGLEYPQPEDTSDKD